MIQAEAGSPHGRGNKNQGSRVDAAPGPTRRRLVSSWRSFPEQVPVLAGDSGIDIVITGVGGGKSAVAAFKMLRFVLKHPRRADGSPTEGCVLGSNFRLVRRVQLEMILEQVRRLPVPYNSIVRRVVSGQEPRIEFWNGVTIYGFSGSDVNRMRGHAFDFVWVDEAEFQTIKSFTMAMQRQRSASAIRLVVTSSPDGAGDGWLWQVISGEYPEWDELRLEVPVRVFRWGSLVNKVNKGGVIRAIATATEATSPGASRQEIGGLFLGTSEAPGGGVVEWAKAFVGRVQGPRPKARSIGVDLGKSEDFCWFTGATNTGIVVAMKRFNLSTVDVSDSEYWPFVRKELLVFAHDYGEEGALLTIDTARGGDQFASAIRGDIAKFQLRLRVDECPTDAGGRKSEICEAFAMAVSLGQYRVPSAFVVDQVAIPVEHVEHLRLEAKKLVVTKLPGGKRKWTHPKGGHDDGIVSASLCHRGLARQPRQGGALNGWTQPG